MAASLEGIAESVCKSETFRSSPRLREFLRYLAKQSAGEGRLKETLIGIEFFQRAPGYDPRKDPIVRVEAHRLRRRLLEYYRMEGAPESWRMELPAGAYVPVLKRVGQTSLERRLAVRVEAPDPLTAEGLAAELIRHLGGLEGVTVLAPASSLRARGAKEAAQQLGANAILDCRLDGIRLQASLSRAEGDRLRPIGTFDNLIQPAVEALAQFVASHLGARRPTGTASRQLLDLETYQLYLAGRAPPTSSTVRLRSWFGLPGDAVPLAPAKCCLIERRSRITAVALAEGLLRRRYGGIDPVKPSQMPNN